MIAAEIRGARQVKAQLDAFPDELRKARRQALLHGGQIIRGHWVLRLSGPAGPDRLGVGHGTLKRSIQVGRIQGDTIRVGTGVKYAAVHEFGFSGPVQVRAHTRLGFPVRAHTRQMRMPARPHRGPAMRDSSGPIAALFRGEVDKAIRESHRIGQQTRESTIAQGFTPSARRTR